MQYDAIVIGAGISGAAAAYELAASRRVLLLEREERPGYHSTGRSAALYTPNYGNATVRAVVRLGHGFLADPPSGFERPLLAPAGSGTPLLVAKYADGSACHFRFDPWPGDYLTPADPLARPRFVPTLLALDPAPNRRVSPLAVGTDAFLWVSEAAPGGVDQSGAVASTAGGRAGR